MRGLRQYEKDERRALMNIHSDMNLLHSQMGGRDRRPERIALLKCMRILIAEIERKTAEVVA